MSDMRAVIVPKSDQMNADDLIAGPRTVRISRVDIRAGADQPVAIHYDGDAGKPYKPCKSMCRVMVTAWGPDAKNYVGRSMTLYRDPSVKWGGMEVGGIRISHMSDLDKTIVLALTATKGSRKPYTVKPLAAEHATPPRGRSSVPSPIPGASSQAGGSASGASTPALGPDADFPGDEAQMDPRVSAIIDDARAAATEGMAAYQQFFGALSREQKTALTESGQHDKLKNTATKAGA